MSIDPSVLFVHSYYQERGGEDSQFEAESKLLEKRGHKVLRYYRHNKDVVNYSKPGLALRTIWNPESYQDIVGLIRRERPAVVQFQNTLPLISPAGYWAAAEAGAAVVQNVQNYRLVCPNALLLKKGQVCELCIGRQFPWPAVLHRCYRNSWTASATVATMLLTHRALGTWSSKVHAFTVPTEFMKSKLIQGGIATDQIAVRSNFINPDPGRGPGGGGFALYVGRLSGEKGVETLLRGWRLLGDDGLPLVIMGGGPLEGAVRQALGPRIRWLGSKPHREVMNVMKRADLVVVPSDCYEGAPLAISEAYAVGTPVLASRHGAMTSMVTEGRTGFFFEPGDPESLAATAAKLSLRHLASLRESARAEYGRRFSADAGYERLISIYGLAIRRAALGGSRA